jgi:serpin B
MRGWLLVAVLGLLAVGRAVAVDGDWGVVGSTSNDFGFRVYAEVAKRSATENCFLSPVGLAAGLAMVTGGAVDDCRKQAVRLLGWKNQSAEVLDSDFKALLGHLHTVDPKILFEYATGLWAAKSNALAADMVKRCADYYRAEARTVDLTRPTTSEVINFWLTTATHGAVPRLVFPQDFTNDHRMMLVNAVSLKLPWETRFEPIRTRPRDFTLIDNKKTTVNMMSRVGNVPYFEDDYLQMVKLACGTGKGWFYVIVPKPKYTIFDLEPVVFTTKNWALYRGQLEARIGEVNLPRLTIGDRTDLANELRGMGMEALFSKDEADFSNLCDGHAWLTLCRQRVNFELAEDGLKPAEPAKEPPTFTFTADRPFLVLFQLDESILFFGHVLKPDAG